MKKLILAVAMAALLPTAAFAGSHAHSSSSSSSSANSYSNSGSNIRISSRGGKAVGAAIPPGLIASGLSCSGSASVGGGWLGGGIAIGFTHKDRDCDTRENAKMVGLMHEMNVAYEIMCGIDEVRKADRAVGRNRCTANRPVTVVHYNRGK